MREHPHMRWSSAIRSMIEQKLDEFDEADRLAKKLNLRMDDFEAVGKKIRDANRESIQALLNESHR